jgi:pimeloyl-ACP methyl ester carboxylesterase
MEYRTLGRGYPLIMIMGFSGTMDLWASDILDALSSHYKVITFDNRGMGETKAGSRKFTIEQ